MKNLKFSVDVRESYRGLKIRYNILLLFVLRLRTGLIKYTGAIQQVIGILAWMPTSNPGKDKECRMPVPIPPRVSGP